MIIVYQSASIANQSVRPKDPGGSLIAANTRAPTRYWRDANVGEVFLTRTPLEARCFVVDLSATVGVSCWWGFLAQVSS